MRNFASIFQLQSPMSRLVSEGGNRTEIDDVLGSVDDCSVSSANLMQFVPPTLKTKGSLRTLRKREELTQLSRSLPDWAKIW